MIFSVNFSTRWSDFDPNRHMRHSAYNDYAAEVRIRYFAETDNPVEMLAKNNIGPILFEEHTFFKKEIHLGEKIEVNLQLLALSPDLRKWKIRHQIFNQQKEISAIVEVFGSWIDLEKRKIISLPTKFESIFHQIEKTQDFKLI